LVMCDLACNWKLDGDTKGHIDAGSSVKIKVDFGQHIIVATTEDDADKVKQLSEIKSTGQTVVSIELQPVRDTRLKAEQAARDKIAEEQRRKEQEKHPLVEPDQQRTPEAVARKEPPTARTHIRPLNDQEKRAEAAGLIWIDPATGLLWTKKHNPGSVKWQKAVSHCQQLELAAHHDWRLPTIDELQGIYIGPGGAGFLDYKPGYAKGNMRLFSKWSSSSGTGPNDAWMFNFMDGKRYSFDKEGYSKDVICVCSIQ
jgi:hypothetical protein